jgi:hypothetical protein
LLTAPALRDRLTERFSAIQFDQAREDIEPFLKDPREVRLWSHDFCGGLIPLIQIGRA